MPGNNIENQMAYFTIRTSRDVKNTITEWSKTSKLSRAAYIEMILISHINKTNQVLYSNIKRPKVDEI